MEYVQVGKVSNTHGNKGDVKVIPLTDDMRSFDELESVYLGMDKEVYDIESVAYQKGQVLVKFSGVDSLRDAEELLNSFLWLKLDEVDRQEGSYFLFEIVGLDVYDTKGSHIGKIKEVLQPGANDVYVVKDGEKEHLIPAVEEIVVDIDLDEKKIVIDPIEGMIE